MDATNLFPVALGTKKKKKALLRKWWWQTTNRNHVTKQNVSTKHQVRHNMYTVVYSILHDEYVQSISNHPVERTTSRLQHRHKLRPSCRWDAERWRYSTFLSRQEHTKSSSGWLRSLTADTEVYYCYMCYTGNQKTNIHRSVLCLYGSHMIT